MGLGSRSLDATAGTEDEMVSRALGSGSSARRFSVDFRAMALKEGG
jgi:hypothetical protein